MHLLSSFSRPIAIVILPLAGLFFERALDEPITGLFGPALYTLYVIGIISFGALVVGAGRLPAAVESLAAGTLLCGAVIVGLIAVIGTLVAALLLLALPLFAVGGALFAAVLVSPWFTARALWELSTRSLRARAQHLGKKLTGLCAITGIGVAIALATLATKADAALARAAA